jgi:hypothetical protein
VKGSAVEIVIPAVLDHRADGDLHVGPDLLHRAGHDMGEVVADQLQRLALVLHGVNGDLRVGLDGPLQVPVGAVHGGADRLFRQRGRDVGRDLGRGHAGGELARVAIGKGQGNLAMIGQSPRRFGAYGTPGCGYGCFNLPDARKGRHCQRRPPSSFQKYGLATSDPGGKDRIAEQQDTHPPGGEDDRAERHLRDPGDHAHGVARRAARKIRWPSSR